MKAPSERNREYAAPTEMMILVDVFLQLCRADGARGQRGARFYCVRGKSGGGLPTPRRWRVGRGLPNRAERLGVRQSSGALERRTGRAGRRKTILPFRLHFSNSGRY